MSTFRFSDESHPLVLLFPGQGSQHVGMAHELAMAYPVAQEALAEADEVLGIGLSQLCFHGPEEELTDTINAQPALMAASVAALRAIESELGAIPRPRLVAGHSMGEYTALVVAGSLGYADGLRLVRERGRLMKEAGEKLPGSMAAVLGLDEEEVASLCAQVSRESGGIVQVANDNCPGQVVISGDPVAMEAAVAAARAAGARRVIPLAVSIAAHSPLMASAAEELSAAVQATPVADPRIPVIANMTAQPLTSATEIRAELVAQLTGSVRWAASMRYALEAGVTCFAEIGPGDVLAGLVKRIERRTSLFNVSDPSGVRDFVRAFGADSAAGADPGPA